MSRTRVFTFCLIFLCGLPLGGCKPGALFGGGLETDYAVSPHLDDKETTEYIETIFEERLTEKTKTVDPGEKDPALRARQEEYVEQTVQADLLRALHARGYYNAAIRYVDGQDPFSGIYNIVYGARFTIGGFHVSPPEYLDHLDDQTPAAGDALDAVRVLAAQARLQDSIGKDRCYFSLSVDNRVVLDRKTMTGDVELQVEAGREGKFGVLSVEGNDTVRETYLRRLLPWKEGDCFRREKLEEYKTTLMQSGLFARADIILPEDGPDADGAVPMKLSMKERAHRTIGAGLTYYSDEGPGGVLSWEHRNFFGSAEKLRAELGLSALKQALTADLTKPFFFRRDQNLSLNAALQRQDTDAFEEFSLKTGGAVSRKFGKHLTFSTGLNASLLRIDDKTLNTTSTYGLLSAPQTISYDTRNDALDPRKGLNLSTTAQPFFDILGEADPFLKTQITASTYLAFDDKGDFVLALKGGFGTIWGADLAAIPATERFYAGGGGTVRGYGYQEVGPKQNGEPSGGRSTVTSSVEMRSKITSTLGGVLFADAGTVSEEEMPDFSGLAIGAGVGLRYYTSFGPIRFDIATPLTQKQDADQSYQFYISIGQSF